MLALFVHKLCSGRTRLMVNAEDGKKKESGYSRFFLAIDRYSLMLFEFFPVAEGDSGGKVGGIILCDHGHLPVPPLGWGVKKVRQR